MPCAGPNHSCNSLLSIRSPLGEIRVGAPDSPKPAHPRLWPLIRGYRAFRETLEHRRQVQALRQLDMRLLRDVGLSPADLVKHRVPSAQTASPLRAAIAWFARRRLPAAAREIDKGTLDRIDHENPDAVHKIRALFGPRGSDS